MADFSNGETDAFLFGGAFAPGAEGSGPLPVLDDVTAAPAASGAPAFSATPTAGPVPAAHSAAEELAPVSAMNAADPSVATPAPAQDPGETAMFMAMAASRSGSAPAGSGFSHAASAAPAVPAVAEHTALPATPARVSAPDETAAFMMAAAGRGTVGESRFSASNAPAAPRHFAPKVPEVAPATTPAPAAQPADAPLSSAHAAGLAFAAAQAAAAPGAHAGRDQASGPSLSVPADSAPAATSPVATGSAPAGTASSHDALAATGPVSTGAVAPHAPRGPHRSAPARDSRPRPSKLGRVRNVVSIALIVIGILLLLTAAGLFVHAQLGYKEAQESYKSLTQYAVVDEAGVDLPQVDWDALAKINDQIVGWIYVPGTKISYPVVQGTDNSTYLTTLFDGTKNASGSIFMDMDDTAPGMVDQQTTLYGHHMNDGSMFNTIDTTTDQAEFDKIDKVYYLTRDNTYTFKPLFTAKIEDTYSDARTPNFLGDTTLSAYLQDMMGHATAKASDASERAASADKVLTLVTCATAFTPTTTRAAMVCTLVE